MRINVITILSVFLGVVSLNAFADKNDGLVDALASCSKISNDEQRLICFDELAPKYVTPPTLMKTSVVSTPLKVQIKSEEAKQIDKFSKDSLKKTKEEKGPDSIIAIISKVKKLIRGQLVIYLENGQKWQQQDLVKMKLKVGDSVRLKKGSMGTVHLYKEGSHRNIRVKRLK